MPKSMSLEAVLDEERREVLSLLEGAQSAATSSPPASTGSPVRSMLDVDAEPLRSMLDVDSPTTTQRRSPRLRSASHRRATSDTTSSGRTTDGVSQYQFSGYLPSNPGGPILPIRASRGGRTAMSPLGLPGQRDERHVYGERSASPLAVRSPSPPSTLRTVGTPPDRRRAQFTLADGRPVDVSSAYRRLSDANLALSSGSLGRLVQGRQRSASGGAVDRPTRLEKDYLDETMSSDEEVFESDGERRGRQTHHDTAPTTVGMGRTPGPRQSLSLLAAAEEERIAEAARAQREPEITVTAPAVERLKSSKPVVHPTTSFDHGLSGISTPVDSASEAELDDIKHAQKLSIHMTPIGSTPATQRCVRTLYRGDFPQMQRQAEENQQRVRKYLVATDLSDEAQHALEWTIGTVLRNGDTLLCIYCADEDTEMQAEPAAAASPLAPADEAAPSRAEQDRVRATQDITDRVCRLLRKTKLQVRVVIEVIHCKIPKHLICEVIDYLNPTLVILGSRGRSALKGVILGSFSNYLVTKSSVPVMVARKRLRKHNKYKRPTKLTNNLHVSGNTLASAKVD